MERNSNRKVQIVNTEMSFTSELDCVPIWCSWSLVMRLCLFLLYFYLHHVNTASIHQVAAVKATLPAVLRITQKTITPEIRKKK